jgi:hypothetical protein
MHGTADPAKDENMFDELRDRSWREGYDVQGDFGDGDQYLSEVCDNGHMLCEKCHVTWERTHRTCPFCRDTLIWSGESRKMQVFHTDEIATQQARNYIFGNTLGNLARIPRTLLQGGFSIRILGYGYSYCGFRSFMPPERAIRPQAYESTTRYFFEVQQPDMTVASMMQRMQMYSDSLNHPTRHERIDAALWKLCIVTRGVVNSYEKDVYKQIDNNLRIVDIPEFVFDYSTQNLLICMNIHEEFWTGLIVPGIATLDEIASIAHSNNKRGRERRLKYGVSKIRRLAPFDF